MEELRLYCRYSFTYMFITACYTIERRSRTKTDDYRSIGVRSSQY